MLPLSSSSTLLKFTRSFSLCLLAKPLFLGTSRPSMQLHTTTNSALDLKPLNLKITNYVRSGLIDEAQKLFDEMRYRNIVTWNAMIRGYFMHGRIDNAVALFNQMPERDIFSYNTVVAGLMQHGDINTAKEIFEKMPCRDVVTWNSMIAGYAQNEMIDEAIATFGKMEVKNVISWNLLIGGLVNCGHTDLAQKYFRQMSGRDVISWTIMISGLSRLGHIDAARELFEDMPSRDVPAWNAMMIGYIENEQIEKAEALFHKMPERDFNSWNEMVKGLIKNRRTNDASRLFMEMPEKRRSAYNIITFEFIKSGLIGEAHAFLEKTPHSGIVSWTNMIIGYFEVGKVKSALKLFESMSARDSTAWNATIFGLGDNDLGEEGLKLFIRMKRSGPLPDKATLTSVLTICSELETLRLGIQIHGFVSKSGFNCCISVSNAMVTMYARCGSMESAMLEFSSMPIRDAISWNSIICGFAHHGNGKKALEMFEQMRLSTIKPNYITFVGVLSACSHAGLVDQGRYYFDFMKSKCLLQPTSEHYTCLVDLLGRFGLIDEAVDMLVQMRENGMEVSASIWGALLGACRIHKNFKVGEIAGERILKEEPHNSGVYLVLAEMYSGSGRREEAERMWGRMRANGVKKQPGCSWIELNNNGHVFLSGDKSHPEFHRISGVVDLLRIEMGVKNVVGFRKTYNFNEDSTVPVDEHKFSNSESFLISRRDFRASSL